MRDSSSCIAPPRTPTGLSLGGGDGDREGLLQPVRVRGRQRSAAGDGRSGLYAGGAGGVLRSPLPRLDDRRGSIEILKNRIAESVFERASRSAR